MQWLLVLETENDPITACRLMNIFRRKGLKILTLSMVAEPEGYRVTTVVDTNGNEAEHIFNFLRRTEGVQHVTWYSHAPTPAPAFVLAEAEGENGALARLLEAFPGSRVVISNSGKCLLEIPEEGVRHPGEIHSQSPGFLPFMRVRSTRREAQFEPVGAPTAR